MLTQNDMDFAIQFVKGILEHLIKSLDSLAFPNFNESFEKNWILNAGYFFDHNDKMVVFSPMFLKAKPDLN